jgi:Domain of unknown function (DUF6089)
MFKPKIIYLIACFTFTVFYANSQKLEFGLGAGITTFKGDISPEFNPLQIGFGGTGLFRYNFSRSVSFRGQLMYGSYNVDDLNTSEGFYNYRGANANGKIFEGAALIDYNFLNMSNIRKQKEWTPYLFGGLGIAFVNQPFGKFKTPIIPYGLGVKYHFNGPFSVCAEFGARFTLSDRFDEQITGNGLKFGNKNPASVDLAYDKKAFSDTERKDQYFFTNITLTYTIFNLVCPKK